MNQQASRLHDSTQMAAQRPLGVQEERSIQDRPSSSQPMMICSDHPSRLDKVRSSDQSTNIAAAGEPLEPEQIVLLAPKNGRPPQKKLEPQISRILSSKSERLITSHIEQLQRAQLKSPQLKELVRRLKRLYSLKPSPSDEDTSQTRRHAYSDVIVGDRWKEIQGCNMWEGLLDPIDPVLRAEIVRYGEFAEATYDAFDHDTSSRYCGSCKYNKESLLEKVGLENRGYEITHLLYATAELDLQNFFTKSFLDDKWSKDSNWMGCVGVCTSKEEIARLGRRDIVVAWRGTITKFEWIKDVQDYLAPAGFDPRNGNKNVMVESGFLSVYMSSNEKSRYNKKSVREQALGAVRELVEKYKHERTPLSITLTGHSLGSALATLCGYDIAESRMNVVSITSPGIPTEWNSEKTDWDECGSSNPHNRGSGPAGVGSLEKPSGTFFPYERIPITVFSFAGPKVGNKAFKERVEELGVTVLRVTNKHDHVTKLPGVLFTEGMEALQKIITFLPSYKHVGVKLEVDNLASHYLVGTRDPILAHNLETYLHLVDGFHGKDFPFERTLRDYVLVNKGGDFLKKEYYIPPRWWQEAHKGLVRDKDGHWVVPERDLELFPVTPEASPEAKNEQHEVEMLQHSVDVAYERSNSRSGYISLVGPVSLSRSVSRLEYVSLGGPHSMPRSASRSVSGVSSGDGEEAAREAISAVSSSETSSEDEGAAQ